jgi:hypothetical protein
MAKTVVGLFDTFAEGQTVVRSLVDAGVSREDISLVANDSRGEYASYANASSSAENAVAVGDTASPAAESAGAGAVGGTVIGGALGLLVGLGALTIPGIGPVIAAGSLATVLGSTALGAGIGAAAGGLVGGLVGVGVPEDEANVYAEGVRRGGTLVTVRAEDTLAPKVYSIMQQAGAVDISERGSSYRSNGWDRFDANSAPYTDGAKVDQDWRDSSKVGTVGGTAAGAATGAAVGSAGGPVGTVIGGLAGAAVGSGVGAAGDVAGERAEDANGDLDTEADVASRRRAAADVRGSARNTDTDDAQSDWRDSSKVGTVTGDVAGAATGAIIGSAAGPVGTVLGGLAGAAVGSGLGAAGDVAGERAVGDSGDINADFRRHYDAHFASSGYTYDQFAPVYRYGYDLGNDTRYQGRDWSLIEGDAHRVWEERNPGTWTQFKDALRYAWDRARNMA